MRKNPDSPFRLIPEGNESTAISTMRWSEHVARDEIKPVEGSVDLSEDWIKIQDQSGQTLRATLMSRLGTSEKFVSIVAINETQN